MPPKLSIRAQGMPEPIFAVWHTVRARASDTWCLTYLDIQNQEKICTFFHHFSYCKKPGHNFFLIFSKLVAQVHNFLLKQTASYSFDFPRIYRCLTTALLSPKSKLLGLSQTGPAATESCACSVCSQPRVPVRYCCRSYAGLYLNE